MSQTMTEPDLITHSPDGESRGLILRAGDVFPTLPTRHVLSAPATSAGDARITADSSCSASARLDRRDGAPATGLSRCPRAC
ncbi:hypothetical protein [Streptosporangium sp. V21-05]|uniref:hypothetical protein n=1 Tax=Streptosporangium sp. V21-05 TaxID=3446115 RepID=UPI003F52D7A5